MTSIQISALLEADAASLERLRSEIGLPRPVGIRRLIDEYRAPVAIAGAITTPRGVPLGGRFSVTLHHDGRYSYRGLLRATGVPSYHASLATVLEWRVPGPDGADWIDQKLALGTAGRVYGKNAIGSSTMSWHQEGRSDLIQMSWLHARRATHTNLLTYKTDWLGSIGGALEVVGKIAVASATAGTAGVAIILAGELADRGGIEKLALPGLVGIGVAGGAYMLLGPSALLPAFLAGAAAAPQQRSLTEEERIFARRVFGASLDFDNIMLTNLTGLGGRAFAMPVIGDVILLNVGQGEEKPLEYTGKGESPTFINNEGKAEPYGKPGQLLVHELVHAWQHQHAGFTPALWCRHIATQARMITGHDPYDLPTLIRPWRALGTEQQAAAVERWFAGQDGQPQMLERDSDPYWPYIRDHIRPGRA